MHKRKKPFCEETKVSIYANFEEHHIEKDGEIGSST